MRNSKYDPNTCIFVDFGKLINVTVHTVDNTFQSI